MKHFNQIITQNLTQFADKIKELGGCVDEIKIKNPASMEQIHVMEHALNLEMPKELKEVFLNFTAGIDYYWDINNILDENDDFLPDELMGIARGELCFDLDFILELERNRKMWIEKVYPNYHDDYDRVYHHKLAFQKVGNGDLIAIDLEPENYGKIVYLSHDGSDNHGRIMAQNFKEFLLNYSAIGCVGSEDWQWEVFCTEQGIDGQGEIAKQWREFLGLKLAIQQTSPFL